MSNVFVTTAKADRFLNHIVPKPNFTQRFQSGGREFTGDEVARMSDKTLDQVEATLHLLRKFVVGSPGSVHIVKTCQVLGMSQMAFLGAIGTDIADTPKMSFQKEFLDPQKGFIIACTLDGYVLTAAGMAMFDGLVGVSARGGSTFIPKVVWRNLMQRISLTGDFKLYAVPQEQAVEVLNVDDLRERFNQARVRRGLRSDASLVSRASLNLDLVKSLGRFSHGGTIGEDLVAELNASPNLNQIMNRIKMVETYEKLASDITVVLEDAELVSLGKMLSFGEKEEFYGLNIEPLRSHAQAEVATQKVQNFRAPRAGMSLGDRLQRNSEIPIGTRVTDGRATPPLPPGGDTSRVRNVDARVRFRTPSGYNTAATPPYTPSETPLDEDTTSVDSNPTPQSSPPPERSPSTGNLSESAVQNAYNNAGEVRPPQVNLRGEGWCSVSQTHLFGEVAVSTQGSRYNRHAVECLGVPMPRDPNTNVDTSWTIEHEPVTMLSAIAQLQHEGVLGDDVDSSNLVVRPTPQQVDLLAVMEGIDPLTLVRAFTFPGLAEEYREYHNLARDEEEPSNAEANVDSYSEPDGEPIEDEPEGIEEGAGAPSGTGEENLGEGENP